MAEGEGFEPPVPFGTTVFKTAAIDRSATPPQGRKDVVNNIFPHLSIYALGTGGGEWCGIW